MTPARGQPALHVPQARLLWGGWSPARTLVVSFGCVIALGTLLLRMPWAAHGQPLTWLDAWFTATSATCVTGLVVVDTGTRLTLAGQVVVAAMIQLGGLGIMTFSTLGILALGKRLRLHQRMVVANTLGLPGHMNLRSLVLRVIALALAFESAGALLLAWRWPAEQWWQALGAGVFHAISAFNNAGFSTLSDSLVRFQHDALVNGVFIVLIVCGGLGFPVLAEVGAVLRRRLAGQRTIVTLHTRVVLAVTAVLLAAATGAIYLLEANGALAHLATGERLVAALFQAVTPRTAGFDTVPMQSLHTATLFVVLLLMFVGGSPGSTAGGVKTTAVGILTAFVVARARGRETVDLFRRTVTDQDVRQAVGVVAAALSVLVVAVFGLLISEQVRDPGFVAGAAGAASPRLAFEVVFEAVSALGTVGLSTGLTPELTATGRVIVIVLMFVGRVGPLTIAMALGRRRATGAYRYPRGRVLVG